MKPAKSTDTKLWAMARSSHPDNWQPGGRRRCVVVVSYLTVSVKHIIIFAKEVFWSWEGLHRRVYIIRLINKLAAANKTSGNI